MREAAGRAVVASRSIAQISWRVVIAFSNPRLRQSRVANVGKACVNRV